jgi:hypothetical protein
MAAERAPAEVLAPRCPCGLPASMHICMLCERQFAHEFLVRIGDGFRCIAQCSPPTLHRVPERKP